jgi:hypothetical protein
VLNLIDHHQTLQVAQGKLRIRQTFNMGGVLQIEVVEGLIKGRCGRPDELTGKRGFSRLARAEESNDLGGPGLIGDLLRTLFTLNDLGYCHEKSAMTTDFS